MAIRPKRQSATDQAISPEAPVDRLRYIVFDTELTSLDHRTNRLLSVGAIAMQGTSILLGEQFYRVVNPVVDIPPESIVIHLIRSQEMATGEETSTAMQELSRFVRGAVLVGHFTHIDLKILRKEMTQIGHTLDNPAIDTARVHQWLLHHGPYAVDLALQLESLDLHSVAKSHGIDPQNEHHALADAFVTAYLWQKLLATLQKNGVTNLKKLLKVGVAE